MKISALIALLEGEMLQASQDDSDIQDAYTSDLLSDVMANAEAGAALITIQAHKNTVAVASLVGAACIVICNNRPVQNDMLEAATSEGIAILRTELNQFESSGRIWQALNKG